MYQLDVSLSGRQAGRHFRGSVIGPAQVIANCTFFWIGPLNVPSLFNTLSSLLHIEIHVFERLSDL